LLGFLEGGPALSLGGGDASSASQADGAPGLRWGLDSGGAFLGCRTQETADLGDLLIDALLLEFKAGKCCFEDEGVQRLWSGHI
jgi:hypothetical protein